MSEHSDGPRRCLDLFSGLGGREDVDGGFSDAFQRDNDWSVTTVDIEPEFDPDICADVFDLRPSDFAQDFDVVVASVPCQYFTTIRNVTKGGDDAWQDGRPATDGSRDAIALVHHTVGLIRGLSPEWWFMENPRGMLRKRYERPEATVWYCQYGHDSAKPTDLWGDHPPTFEYRTCRYGNDECGHTRTQSYKEHGGGSDNRQGILIESDAAERALVPAELSAAIKRSIEDYDAGRGTREGDLSGWLD